MDSLGSQSLDSSSIVFIVYSPNDFISIEGQNNMNRLCFHINDQQDYDWLVIACLPDSRN